MRRLIHSTSIAVLALALCSTLACRREDKIKLEATDESQPVLASVVRAADSKTAMQLTKGFHAVEQNSWRWTMGHFAITLAPPAGSAERGASLLLKISVPEPVAQKVKKVTLSASVGDTAVGSDTYTSAGEHTFRADIPATALKGEAVTVAFALDPILPAGTLDSRELGIIFVSASLEAK